MVFKAIEVGQIFYTVNEKFNVIIHVCEQVYDLTRNNIGPVRIVTAGTLAWYEFDVFDKIENAYEDCENTRRILREMLDGSKEEQAAIEAAADV